MFASSTRCNPVLLAVLVAAASLLAAGRCPAQIRILKDQPDLKVTPEQRTEVIDGVIKNVTEFYVYPEKGKQMAKALRTRQENKEYDAITSAKVLAETLTAHLQEIGHDKHLRLMYSHDSLPRKRTLTAQDRERMRSMQSKGNYGFEKIERLDGNIGYLELRGFLDAEAGGDTAAAAMTFLGNTDALIIDLRHNGGGSPGMVALLCSYFFAGERKHLNDLIWREEGGERIDQWWTLPHVPGKRYVDKDVYILTSKRTFSAAEEFTYDLQALKRATVVGETTGGGAHPGGPRPINDHFVIFMPSGRAVNPITKTNWEGTGVKPDVEAPADQALQTAHLLALNKLLAKADADPRWKEQLQRSIDKTRKELDERKKQPEPSPAVPPGNKR
jgi:C-terminal processing protease CtpA/Prc